mmetsp:Transcript_15284/g.33476  ORF Transcript_15284/g.33476 Transcript_15284/m.33476 type:complete len:201 (+) Transcript_15284:422-1024(+)
MDEPAVAGSLMSSYHEGPLVDSAKSFKDVYLSNSALINASSSGVKLFAESCTNGSADGFFIWDAAAASEAASLAVAVGAVVVAAAVLGISNSGGFSTAALFFTRRRIFFLGGGLGPSSTVVAGAAPATAAPPMPGASSPGRVVCTFVEKASSSLFVLIVLRKENASFNSCWAFLISSNCSWLSMLLSKEVVRSFPNVRIF